MRKLLMWIVVSVGIAALVRKLRRRGDDGTSEAESAPDDSEADDPADELRRKLADTRDDAAPAATAMAGATAEPEEPVDARRSEVHDEGRALIDEMQRSTES